MYYSFRCTYCGRLFYTYDRSRERASRTLYYTVKQHLVDFDEDRKEHEMDDGEQVDSDQIYAEMREYNDVPAGGYEATVTSAGGEVHSSSSTGSSKKSGLLLVIAVILGILVVLALCLIVFFPVVLAFMQQFLH